jgi:hypothetical protein
MQSLSNIFAAQTANQFLNSMYVQNRSFWRAVRDRKRRGRKKTPTAAGPTNNQKERDAAGHGWENYNHYRAVIASRMLDAMLYNATVKISQLLQTRLTPKMP